MIKIEDAYEEGWFCFVQDGSIDENPYSALSIEYYDWCQGFIDTIKALE